MKRLEFCVYENFAAHIIDSLFGLDDEYSDISIIAKYNEAKSIVKELIAFADFSIESIELEKAEYNNYFDEYIVSLTKDGGLWCEPFKRDTGYLFNESVIAYVMDNCSSKVLQTCDCKTIYEVSVGEEDDDVHSYDKIFCDEEPCNEKTCDEDDMHGFSVSGSNDNGNYSYSFYTTEDIDMEDIKKLLSKFSLAIK